MLDTNYLLTTWVVWNVIAPTLQYFRIPWEIEKVKINSSERREESSLAVSIVKIIHQPLSTLSWVLTISTKCEIVVHMKIFCFMWSDWRKSYHTVRIVAVSSSTTFDFSLMSPPIAAYSDHYYGGFVCDICIWPHHHHWPGSQYDWKTQGELLHLLLLTPPSPTIITSSLTMMDGWLKSEPSSGVGVVIIDNDGWIIERWAA